MNRLTTSNCSSTHQRPKYFRSVSANVSNIHMGRSTSLPTNQIPVTKSLSDHSTVTKSEKNSLNNIEATPVTNISKSSIFTNMNKFEAIPYEDELERFEECSLSTIKRLHEDCSTTNGHVCGITGNDSGNVPSQTLLEENEDDRDGVFDAPLSPSKSERSQTHSSVESCTHHIDHDAKSNSCTKAMVTSTGNTGGLEWSPRTAQRLARSMSCTSKFPDNIHRTLASDVTRFQMRMHEDFVELRRPDNSAKNRASALDNLLKIMDTAWATPKYGLDLAYSLCSYLRTEKMLETLVNMCTISDNDLHLKAACVLQEVLTTENRTYVAKEIGLEPLVLMSQQSQQDTAFCRAAIGVLESMFKDSEETSRRLITLGGLDSVLYACRSTDVSTLRHCAVTLSNLALYGGCENQREMLRLNVPEWLFPLALSTDEHTKYYAFLAIAVLCANREIEAKVAKSDTLKMVETFVKSHSPDVFARSYFYHRQGQSKDWLKRIAPLLCSSRSESQCLAAFHFAMEAFVKKEQRKTKIFQEIGVVKCLQSVVTSPNKLASQFAEQALKTIGEEIPYKLSNKVSLWTVKDVIHWVKISGFKDFTVAFEMSQVDGDLLLRLTDSQLREDLGMTNSLLRRRFLRSLLDLKTRADYTHMESANNLVNFLSRISPVYLSYAYSLLSAGVSLSTMPCLKEEHLLKDCHIENGVHRLRLLQEVKELKRKTRSRSQTTPGGSSTVKTIDVFISYRRVGGAQLASLLKVHLQLKGFAVFLDIERLKAGKFPDSLLRSVQLAKAFILVLSPGALDRCIDDHDRKDWIHKEVVTAINSNCTIIPVTDSFCWPDIDKLPRDMRPLVNFNSVKWIHDYQEACIDRIVDFLTKEDNQKTPRIHENANPMKFPDARTPDYLSTLAADGGSVSHHHASSLSSNPSVDIHPHNVLSFPSNDSTSVSQKSDSTKQFSSVNTPSSAGLSTNLSSSAILTGDSATTGVIIDNGEEPPRVKSTNGGENRIHMPPITPFDRDSNNKGTNIFFAQTSSSNGNPSQKHNTTSGTVISRDSLNTDSTNDSPQITTDVSFSTNTHNDIMNKESDAKAIDNQYVSHRLHRKDVDNVANVQSDVNDVERVSRDHNRYSADVVDLAEEVFSYDQVEAHPSGDRPTFKTIQERKHYLKLNLTNSSKRSKSYSGLSRIITRKLPISDQSGEIGFDSNNLSSSNSSSSLDSNCAAMALGDVEILPRAAPVSEAYRHSSSCCWKKLVRESNRSKNASDNDDDIIVNGDDVDIDGLRKRRNYDGDETNDIDNKNKYY